MKGYQQTVCVVAILQDLCGITKQLWLLLLLFYSTLAWPQTASQVAICQQHLQANRLMVGQGGNNAYSCFKALLSDYPDSDAVYLGLQEIETRYMLLIDQALDDGKEETAMLYLNRLQQVVDDDERFEKLKQRWNENNSDAKEGGEGEQTSETAQNVQPIMQAEENVVNSMRQQLDDCRQLLQSSQHHSAFDCYQQRLQHLITEQPNYYPGAPDEGAGTEVAPLSR